MPLYEYECDACGHRFEVIQKFADAPVELCPVCSGSVRKLQSAPAFQFKGSGWYITDYARKDQGKEQGKDHGKEAVEGHEPKAAGGDAAATGQAGGKVDKAGKVQTSQKAGVGETPASSAKSERAEKAGRKSDV